MPQVHIYTEVIKIGYCSSETIFDYPVTLILCLDKIINDLIWDIEVVLKMEILKIELIQQFMPLTYLNLLQFIQRKQT